MSQRQVLPANVKPVHYDLVLKPDLTAFTFEGRATVQLAIKEKTSVITLNVKELEIHTAKLCSASLKTESSQAATKIDYDTKKDTASLTFAEPLEAGTEATLDMTFKGILNDQMAGFYRSKYEDGKGETKYLATTQFEATDARRAFPCWDEPALKATFDVTLIVPSDLVALSNMNVISEQPVVGAGKEALSKVEGKIEGKTEGKTEGQTGKDVGAITYKQVKYATTPIMSTYLLAFVVAPLEYIEAETSGEHNGKPITVRVYALPGSVEQGRHALDVCVKGLEYFAKVFGIKYPLPKMDMVAIPDFEAGAMENWGLVTYRTIALLFDEKNSSAGFKKRVAYTVCHELAHQWFGNLVTMEWWDHLWLNEGFATWVGWLAVDNIFPDWDVWTSFVTEDMPMALTLDALRSSHPIEVSVNDPSEIHQIFDAISYYKGASVIRMLSSWLGVDLFLAGVRRYLQRHQYSNASTNDLWAALSEEANLDVEEFMLLWTKMVGYPVLNLSVGKGGGIEITQSRYLSTGDLQSNEDKTTWWVPLNVNTGKHVGTKQSLTLTEKSQHFDLGTDSVFKLNANQTGVYRVNYPADFLKRLGAEAKKGKSGLLAATTDRVGLISDTGSLAVSGEQKTSALLDLMLEYTDETEYFVWVQLSTYIGNIFSTFYAQPEPVLDGLRALRRKLFGPLAHRLGWEVSPSDDYLTTMLRSLAIANAGRGRDPLVITEASTRFWKFTEDRNALHPNFRSSVYEMMLDNAQSHEEEERIWNAILDVYEDKSLPSDQTLIALRSLADAKSPQLLERTLELAMDSSKVRGQDIIYVFRSMGSNPAGRELVWKFFHDHYELLHQRFAHNLNIFGYIVGSVIDGFSDNAKIADVEDFFKDKDTKEYARPLQQAIEMANVNAKWVTRDSEDIQEWVKRFA